MPTERPERTRRRYIAVVGSVGLGVLAGCSDDDGSDGSGLGNGTDARNGDDRSEGWPVAGRTAHNRTYVRNRGPGEDLKRRWRWRIEPPENVRIPEDYGDEYTFAQYSYSTPVSDGDRLYLLVSGRATLNEESERDEAYVNRLVALDPETGGTDWQTPFADESETYSPNVLGPAVQDGVVVMVFQRIQAYGTDGEREWQVEYEGPPSGPVIAVGGDVFLPTIDGMETYALADGSQRWSALDRVNTAEVVAVTDEVVYVPVGNEVVALARTSGEERWRADAGVESFVLDPGGRTAVGSPVVSDDSVSVASGFRTAIQGDSGGLVALDRASGDERWQFRPTHPEADEPGPGSGIFGMPALADGTLYAAGATGASSGGPNCRGVPYGLSEQTASSTPRRRRG